MADKTVTQLSVRPLPGCTFRQYAAGEILGVGDLVYMKSDGKVWKSDADAAGTAYAIGVVVAISTFGALDAVAGDMVSVALSGPVAGFTLATPGALMFVSGTAGKLADAAGSTAVPFGQALEANILYIWPSKQASAALTAIDGSSVTVVANDAVVGGVPVIHMIAIAAGSVGAKNVVLTNKTKVLDVWVVLKGAGISACTLVVGNGANAITDLMAVSGSDQAIVRAASINDANQTINASGSLRVTTATGATQPDCEVYVLGVVVS